jgi:hypothetical protein
MSEVTLPALKHGLIAWAEEEHLAVAAFFDRCA